MDKIGSDFQKMLRTKFSQYSIIAGLPADLEYANLEAKVVEMFFNIGCNIGSEKIDARHNMSKTVRTL